MAKKLPVKIWWIISRIDGKTWKREYLLLKRTEQDWWFWQCITWTLHEGESFVTCLKREINEETWILERMILSISDLFHSFTWNKADGRLIHEFVYSVVVNDNWFVPKLSPEEHDQYMWADYTIAMQTLYTENNKNSLKILQEKITWWIF